MPEVWKRLRETVVALPAGTRGAHLDAIAGAAGLAVDTETDIPEELEAWLSEAMAESSGSADRALLKIVEDPRYQVIVEPRALRVVTRLAANLFWRRWLTGRPVR